MASRTIRQPEKYSYQPHKGRTSPDPRDFTSSVSSSPFQTFLSLVLYPLPDFNNSYQDPYLLKMKLLTVLLLATTTLSLAKPMDHNRRMVSPNPISK